MARIKSMLPPSLLLFLALIRLSSFKANAFVSNVRRDCDHRSENPLSFSNTFNTARITSKTSICKIQYQQPGIDNNDLLQSNPSPHVSSLSISTLTETKATTNIVKEEKDNGATSTAAVTDAAEYDEPPRLVALRKMLPKKSFEIDTRLSLLYFVLDLVGVSVAMKTLHYIVTASSWYNSIPFPLLKGLAIFPFQFATGFAMWCMWCIGHDAGHSLISPKKKWINRLVGEISHSICCLTPFKPWQKSHRKHHLNHNHLTRDYSHQWYILEEKDDLHPGIKFCHDTRNFHMPFFYITYLLGGIPDGGHVFFFGRMWDEDLAGKNGEEINITSNKAAQIRKEKWNCALSPLLSVLTSAYLWSRLGFADFTVVCMVPFCIMSFLIHTVTYLQHHSDDGKLYTDETYTFERGAFETVDRDYGQIVNNLSHHLMDGHVVHHLFFDRVPHYRLPAATAALVRGLEAANKLHVYKHIPTKGWLLEIFKQFDKNWFFISKTKIVEQWPHNTAKA